jgi:hypothetical protein
MPASTVFGRELSLPCDLLFGASPDKEQSETDYVADPVDRLHNIYHYACQHLKAATDRIKASYDRLADSAGFQEGDQLWLYRPTRTRGKSPSHQPSWEGSYKMISRINDVVYRIQRHPRAKMMVVHLGRLVPYLGAPRDGQPWAALSRTCGIRTHARPSPHPTVTSVRFVRRLLGTSTAF